MKYTLLAVLVAIINCTNNQKMSGYIIFTDEAAVFAYDLEYFSNQEVVISDLVWISSKSDKILYNDLYDRSYKVYNEDSSRVIGIIEVVLEGTINSKIDQNYGHLDQYNSELEIENITRSSIDGLKELIPKRYSPP